jgi:hypothetical protein
MEPETNEPTLRQTETRNDRPPGPGDTPRIPTTTGGDTPRIPTTRGETLGLRTTDEAHCATCGTGAAPAPPAYVYALGRIEARFPKLGVEKEFAQVTGRLENAGKTSRQVFQAALSTPENRYLARQMCWVLTVQGLETYILRPRDPVDLSLLVGAIRSAPGPGDIDCVVGLRGNLAPPDLCNGLILPVVAFDQIYSFDRETFIKAVPAPAGVKAEQFGPAVAEVFDRIAQLSDNAGATDEHRALNFLVMRYAAIYAKAAEALTEDQALSGVDVRPSSLSGARNVVEVIFSFTNRRTDFTEKFFVRVDVTEEFPFLVTKLSPYYDR